MNILWLVISSLVFNKHSVQKSLKKILDNAELKSMKTTPENGVIILSGLEHFQVIIPPMPVSKNYYKCDSKFHIDSFNELFNTFSKYLICIVDNSEIKIQLLLGTRWSTVFRYKIDLPTDSRRGGFSANRFHRIRMEKRNLLIDKLITELCNLGKLHSHNTLFFGCSELFKSIIDECKKIPDLKIIGIESINDSCNLDTIRKQSQLCITRHENSELYTRLQTEIDNTIFNPDLYLFGMSEIILNDTEYLVRTIFYDSNTVLPDLNCQDLISVPNMTSFGYGEIIGVLYY